MKRSERKIYTRCIAIMAAYIIAGVWFYTCPVSAEKAVFTDDSLAVDNFTAEDAETDLRAVFDENSAMPCCDRESFEKWMETYEQETSEEVDDGERQEDRGEVPECETYCEVSETETETVQEVLLSAPTIYSVDGQVLNPDLQEYLYNRLAENQLEWFMPYSILICYQESRFDQYAVNPYNGIDCGLFQFRAPYYEGQDIFNPYEQIDIFARQMANRANNGKTVSEMISAHNVSDYGAYNQTYVNQVMAHAENLRKVE